MDPWSALLARASAERMLVAEGRWEELSDSIAERVRMAAELGPAPQGARLALQALAVVHEEVTSALQQARAATQRELAGLSAGRGAVAGYAAAQAPQARNWVNDQA